LFPMYFNVKYFHSNRISKSLIPKHYFAKNIFNAINKSTTANIFCNASFGSWIAILAPIHPPKINPIQIKAAILKSTYPCW